MKYLLIVALLLPLNSFAADPWSDGDIYREVAYQVIATIDWGQTLYIAKNPQIFSEKNSTLGRNPSISAVNAYFIKMQLAHLILSHVLPSEWRNGFQYLTIGGELETVGHNYNVGIKIGF